MADRRICLVNDSQIARKVLKPSDTKLSSFRDEVVCSLERGARRTRGRIKIHRKIDYEASSVGRIRLVPYRPQRKSNETLRFYVKNRNPLIPRRGGMKKRRGEGRERKQRDTTGAVAAKVLTAQTGSGWPGGHAHSFSLQKYVGRNRRRVSPRARIHTQTHTRKQFLYLLFPPFSVIVLCRSSRTALKFDRAGRVFERSGSFPSPFCSNDNGSKKHARFPVDPEKSEISVSFFRLEGRASIPTEIVSERGSFLGATVKYPGFQV